MAYVAGDTITAGEYNAFVTNSSSPFGYNHFAGVGATVYGLGQTEIGAVSGTETTVTAANWNSLITGLVNMADHQQLSITARTAVTAGDTIAIKSAVATDLAAIAAKVAAGSPDATDLTTSSALQTITSGSEGWNATAIQDVKATFANGNNMRYFFNGGGVIRLNFDTSAAAVSTKDTAFDNLCTALGNLDIASLATTRSGSGETLTTNGLGLGFYDLTTSFQDIIKLTSDNSGYTQLSLLVEAKTEGGNGNSGDATSIVVKMTAANGSDSNGAFDSNNLSSVATDINNTPKMITKLITITPNTDGGLATAYGTSATSSSTNSVND